MRRLVVVVSCLFALCAEARALRPVPNVWRAPKLDGKLTELARGAPFASPNRALQGRAAVFRSTLYLGITAPDVGEPLEVGLHFPESGVSAPGYRYTFDASGLAAKQGEAAAPAFAQQLVKVASRAAKHGRSWEIAIPLTAFPRFPRKGPMKLELCVTMEKASTCENGSMPTPLQLPDSLRRELKIKPPADVISLEPADRGWLGYGILFYPEWIEANEPITREVMGRLLPGEQVDAQSAHVNVPRELVMRGGKKILSVLSGQDPYYQPGECDGDRELRLGLFLLEGRTATRVLDRPAATCALGEVTSMTLEDDGTLSVSYSNGGTTNFVWSKGKFEQTEIG